MTTRRLMILILGSIALVAERCHCATKCYSCNSCESQTDVIEQDCEKYYGFTIPYSCQITAFVPDDLDPTEEDWFIWGGICMPTSLCESNSTKVNGYTIHFDCCSRNLCNTHRAAYKLAKRRRNGSSGRLDAPLNARLLGGTLVLFHLCFIKKIYF